MNDRQAAMALIDFGLTVSRPGGIVWEPYCFQGEVAEALSSYKNRNGVELTVLATDTRSRVASCQEEVDFLQVALDEVSPDIEAIVTRPPPTLRQLVYGHAAAMMERNRGALLMLVDRHAKFSDNTRRPNAFLRLGVATQPSLTKRMWVYWDWRLPEPVRPELLFIEPRAVAA